VSGYDNLMNRLSAGERILIDGGTGTECERRGIPQVDLAWNSGGALSHPDIVRQVHRDYIDLGAQVVISNTFATGRNIMEDAGRAGDFDAYNRRGVELAREARDAAGAYQVLVAGGISYWSWAVPPTLERLHENTVEQARIMADAGADLLMLEMMVGIERMQVVLDAASSAGLPIWVGITCGTEEGDPIGDDGVMRLRDGDSLADALAFLDPAITPVVSIMHTDVDLIDGCLDVLEQHWIGHTGVYAHSGEYVDGRWEFNGTMSAERYAEAAAGWAARGVDVIGGCCGIGPEHIHRIADTIRFS